MSLWAFNDDFLQYKSKSNTRFLPSALQICPRATTVVSDLNPQLKTLNGKVSCLVSQSAVSLVMNTWVSFCLYAVLAKVDKYAEIEYSMVSSPTVLKSSIDLSLKVKNYATLHFYRNLKISFLLVLKNLEHCFLGLLSQGEFYNIGKHQEPPFSPAAFNLPPQNNNMLYIGMSAFTVNSAAFVYNNAGVLSLSITDDMVNCCLLSLIPSFQDIKLI